MVDNDSPRVRQLYSILEEVARLPLMVYTIVGLYSLDFMLSCHWIPFCNSRVSMHDGHLSTSYCTLAATILILHRREYV